MRRLTLGFLTFADLSPVELISAARVGGFDSVGLRVTGRFKADPFFPVLGNPAAVKDIRKRLDDEGVRLSSISAYYVSPTASVDDFKSVIDVSAELGAPLIVANRHEPDDQRYFPIMEAYCDMAAKAGIRIAIEFMRYSACPTLQAAMGIIDKLGRPNFGLLADPLHLSRSGGTPADLAAVPRERIYLAQLCDAKGPPPQDIEGLMKEARGGRLSPGLGDLPLDAFLDALPPELELEIEVPQPATPDQTTAQRAHAIGDVCRAFVTSHDHNRGAARA